MYHSKYHSILILLIIFLPNHAGSDERQECRKSIHTSQSKIVECIERGIYDPCDDAGASRATYLCAWAHVEVAEKRINKSVEEFLSLAKLWQLPNKQSDNFLESERLWKDYRKNYCAYTDELARYFIQYSNEAIIPMGMSTSEGFCYRRITEKHADELEFALSKYSDKL